MPPLPEPIPEPLAPYWSTRDEETVRLYLGDVLRVLRGMPDTSVQVICTSPPYWGLRDYQTGTWEGGSKDCDHKQVTGGLVKGGTLVGPGNREGFSSDGQYKQVCGKCGAKRVDEQLGSEATPQEYVDKMVVIFREVRRVLRDDGTVFLNLGDSYSGGKTGRADKLDGGGLYPGVQSGWHPEMTRERKAEGLPSGNLVGIPWRVALALQADGWMLRQDIVWSKPAPMPESVKNRCTKAHEYIFLLTKGMGYFYDANAVREDGEGYGRGMGPAAFRSNRYINNNASINNAVPEEASGSHTHSYEGGRNKRSVWTVDDHSALLCWVAENNPDILAEYLAQSSNKLDVWKVASKGYPGAHFATFPPKLIRPCILAGTSEKGACVECGAPWKRVVEEKKLTRDRPNEYVKRTGEEGTGNSCANTVAGVDVKTVGWEPTCECEFYSLRDDVPASVLEELASLGII